MKSTSYCYAVIVKNYPALDRETVLLKNRYKKTKYAFIEKVSQKDGSEAISNIYYSNDLAALQLKAEGYVSWYNYPANLYKDMQQNISHLVK
jgi:MinD superfamily P-loop ATPase